MARITAWIEAFALSIGGPGLFIIAFLDSSFLSFPEVNDLLIVLMVVNHPERMVFYATMATLGSIAGCLALYVVGRKGGDALLRKRFSGGTVERAREPDAEVRRHGADRAGAAAASRAFQDLRADGRRGEHSARDLHLGHRRGTRRPVFWRGDSGGLYGQQAIDYIHENGRTVALAMGLLVLAGGVGFYAWKRRSRRT